MFSGIHTALVTPFDAAQRDLDEAAYQRLIQKQLAAGIHGIVPVGTTGESPTLNHQEHIRVIELAAQEVQASSHNCQIIAGTGSNSTREAIALTQAAEKAGATAALIVTPYYNKPSQEGLYQHFKAIADATSLPIMLYSIPGRCVIQIEIDTLERLAEACPNIQAIKEASGLVERVEGIQSALGDRLDILSGDDALTLPFMAAGACGIVSVASNLVPAPLVEMVNARLNGDLQKAETLNQAYQPLFQALLTLDVNPVPIKTALAHLGEITDSFRLPLVGMSPDKKAQLLEVLQAIKLI